MLYFFKLTKNNETVYLVHRLPYKQSEFQSLVKDARHMYDEEECKDCGLCDGFEDNVACVNFRMIVRNLVNVYGFRLILLNGLVKL